MTPGRLEALDLSLRLTRKEEERGLALGWQRLAHLRLTLGGLIKFWLHISPTRSS